MMQRFIKLVRVVPLLVTLFSLFVFLSAGAESPTLLSLTPTPRVQLPTPAATATSQKPQVRTTRQRVRTPNACGTASQTTLPSNAIIVDDLSANFHRYGTATWYEATGTTGYYNGHMYWLWNRENDVANYAIWDAPATSGLYRVFAFIPSNHAYTTWAWYTIGRNGNETTCTIDQSIYYAVWVDLGTYQFGSGAGNYVKLDDYTVEPSGTTQVGFDAVAFVPQGPSKAYLPFIVRSPSTSELYAKTGIHLGNRDRDWNINASGQSVDFLARLRGSGRPATVVVLSHQVYNINRDSGSNNCNITDATVKNPAVFNYLRDATQAGTKVLIRLWPSPGDFQDTFIYSKPHTLFNLAGQTPQSNNYCGTHVVPGTTDYQPMPWFFRSIDDLAREMNAIHALNVANGFSEYGFIPANEPNNEWYSDWRNKDPNLFPKVSDEEAWQAMDAYFQSLYDYVRANYSPNIRVLTPPMAQDNYAEARSWEDIMNPGQCDPRWPGGAAGYDFMPYTYNSKNDGFAWNNYYRQGKEPWANTDGGQDYCGVSDHVFQYMPYWLTNQVKNSGKLSFISETDLYSPCFRSDNPITDKDANPTLTRDSLWSFLGQEQGAKYPVVWLLSEDPYSTKEKCADPNLTNYLEIKWHEGYRNDGTIRPWFDLWWNP